MYSSSFGVTLIALTMITTVVILAVTSNVVLSLGMVGALSIVRFRTAIKEPLDIAFLFWSIGVGIVRYHDLFSQFIERWFAEGQLAQLIEETQVLLQSFVEKDPTKFCTVEEFGIGVQTIKKFVTLRAEAVSRQLSGDASEVDATGVDTFDMGSMGDTMGGFSGRNGGDFMADNSGPDSGEKSFPADRQSSENGKSSENRGVPSIRPGEDESGGFQDFSDMRPGMSPWRNISSDAVGGSRTNSPLLLLGISVILLFGGLFVAIRVRN